MAATKAKASKEEASYQHYPHQHKRCDHCVNFDKPSTCEKVEGEISKHGYCKLFEASRSSRWYGGANG